MSEEFSNEKDLKEGFKYYEILRLSGKINMLDLKAGTTLTGLTKDQYMYVIKNYKILSERYPEILEESYREMEDLLCPEKE